MRLLLLALLCGCEDKPIVSPDEDETTDEGDDPSDSVECDGEPAVEADPNAAPTSGWYVLSYVGGWCGSCGFDDDTLSEMGDELGLQIFTVEDGGATVVIGDDPGDPACPLEGGAFDCLIDEDAERIDDGDATLTTETRLNGEWLTASYIFGSLVFEYGCEGEDCFFLGIHFPCTLERRYEAERYGR